MTDIPNATEVSSDVVKVPPDPGCYVVRYYSTGRGWRTSEHNVGDERHVRLLAECYPRDQGAHATRIVRIPPQGEQPDAVAVPKRLLQRWADELCDGDATKRATACVSDEILGMLKGG